MTVDVRAPTNSANRLPDIGALRSIRRMLLDPRVRGTTVQDPEVTRRWRVAGRVVAAVSVASLAVPKPHEGMVLLHLSRQHGLTVSSLASLIGLAAGLVILAKVHGGYQALWADSVVSRGGPLVLLGLGLGASATLLSDGLEWMWVPAGGLVLLGLCLDKPDLEREAPT